MQLARALELPFDWLPVCELGHALMAAMLLIYIVLNSYCETPEGVKHCLAFELTTNLLVCDYFPRDCVD